MSKLCLTCGEIIIDTSFLMIGSNTGKEGPKKVLKKIIDFWFGSIFGTSEKAHINCTYCVICQKPLGYDGKYDGL